MLIYFDRQGAIREIVSSYKLSDGTASFKRAEGNSSANRIYCYFEGLATALPSAAAGAMSYRLPDGSIIGPRVSDALETLSIDFDARRDLRYFAYDKDYIFLRFDVPDEAFSLSGLISATASVTIGEATYQFGPITFMVDGEVLAQADIDYSQWRYLISQFARYLPLSGGTMAGAIISEGTGRKATFGDGILKLEDTVYGRETEIGKYAITADGGKFYYPPTAEAGGTLITDKWSGFQNYLPISGGEITGEITTNNDEIEQKVIIGNGRIGVNDTDEGAITYFDANYIERVGHRFYYPEWIEYGGNLITNKWTGFQNYLTKADAEQGYAKKADLESYATKKDLEDYATKADLNGYATKADLNGYATKKDFDDLKSIVYGIHSLTYNSYEFSYLTSSAIPDEVDGRKVVGGSYAIMDWVGGNSVAFNQLVSDTQIFLSGNKISVDYNNTTHQYTFKTNSTDWAVSNATSFTWINGHKYLVKINLISKTENAKLRLRYPTVISETSIITPTENLNLFGIQIQSTDGNEATVIFTINVFDLTRMGLDNITSVDEFKALFPDDYYPYNSGEIKSTIISKIESWGYNLFDGELEQGAINNSTGVKEASSSAIRTKNYIKVIGGKSYTLEQDNFIKETDYVARLLYKYDNSYNYLGFVNIYSTNTVTLDNNCSYVLFAYIKGGITIPTDPQICFHLAGSRTGYAPYVGKLGQINIPNAPLKLDGVNDIHNTLAFEEQEDGTYNAILKGNTAEYTFTGNEALSSYGTAGYYVSDTILTNAKTGSGLVSDYFADSSNDINPIANGTAICAGISSNTIFFSTVTDGNRLSVAETLALIKGKKVLYPTTTPTTETIATGLKFGQVSFPIEKGGTIEAVYEGVPPTASVDFMTKGE